MTTQRMPLLFVGHGSPMNAVEENAWTGKWEELGKSLPRPKAILCISAHFMTRVTQVVDLVSPTTIHDFYGFPQALYAMRYPAPGSPELALRVQELLPKVQATKEWGFDHGAWSVLCRMYPAADIPVVQLSLDLSLSPAQQMDTGRALAPLRDEGVLIFASGNVVHNLRLVNPAQAGPFDWASDFGAAVHGIALSGEWQSLRDYRALPGAGLAVPTTEHFVPLLYFAGAADRGENVSSFNHDYCFGSLSMTSYLIGAGA